MDPAPVDQPDVIIDSDDSEESAQVKEEDVIESIEVDQFEHVDHRNGEGSAAAFANDNDEEYLELSPLEQSAPRRYIRIAIAMPWEYHESFECKQQGEVLERVTDAFVMTVCRWPYLGGSFILPDTDDGEIKLKYTEDVDERSVREQVRLWCIAVWDKTQVANLYHLETKDFSRNRFRWGSAPTIGHFPPVTAKLTFDRGAAIVGFSFSEIIFDGETIRNFFDHFIQSTYGAHANTFLAEPRTIPTSETDQVDFNLFPCFDWSGCDPERRTCPMALRSKVFIIEAHIIHQLYRDIQEAIFQDGTEGTALFEDCVLALFWVVIMRARFLNGRINHQDKAHAFYSVPGAANLRRPQQVNPDHCGNTTIIPVATCSAEDLIRPPETHEEELRRRVHVSDVATAAQVLRRTLRSVTEDHLSQLVALKRLRDPIHTNAALERALRRHTDCLAFEDWTSYLSTYDPCIPWVRDPRVYFFPCYDDLQEGTVILLPRKDDYDDFEDWNICVCLAKDDMEVTEEILERDSWWSSPQ